MGFPLPGHNYEMRYVTSKLKSDLEILSRVPYAGKKSLLNIVFYRFFLPLENLVRAGVKRF